MIQIKRVYAAKGRKDGRRFLVDRLWPRGLSKGKAAFSGWVREAAPSSPLRHWFGHNPKRWPEFRKRYLRELSARRSALKPLVAAAGKGTVTLLFAAKDERHNNAVVLRSYLSRRISR